MPAIVEEKKLGRDLFTTGQVARMLGIAPRTVSKWLDAGRLKGYRLPGGSRDRRVKRQALVAFCEANGLPLPDALRSPNCILAGAPEALTACLRDLLGDEIVLAAAENTFAAGLLYSKHRTAVVVLDCQGLGRYQALAAVRDLARLEQPPRVIVLANEDEAATAELAAAGAQDIFIRPFAPRELADQVRQGGQG